MNKKAVFECFRRVVIADCKRQGTKVPADIDMPYEEFLESYNESRDDIAFIFDYATYLIEDYKNGLLD